MFATTTARKIKMLKYATLRIRNAILYEHEFLSGDFRSIFCAKIKIKPTATVTVNFKITNAEMSELTKPAKIGLSSRAPKYRAPITVVKQSIVPKKIRNKLGTVCVLCKMIVLLSY